eukprot:ANDGO_06947.mRNA.1 hypothetical protein
MAVVIPKTNLAIVGVVFCTLVALVLFGLSASQTQNQQQTGNSDQCTDVTKGQFTAIYRPSRWISNQDSNSGNDKYSVCSWRPVNSGLRMSLSLIVFLSSVVSVYCLYVYIPLGVIIHVTILFVSGSLLMGCMVFDADDVRSSSTWCESGDKTTGAPQNVKCDYTPYTITILIEAVTFLIFIPASFMLFKHWKNMRLALRGAAPSGQKFNNPAHQPSAVAGGPAPAI